MIELYATVSSEPAGRVVNTHHNGDHCWGNQLLRDAEIIGHRLCAEAMMKDLKPELLQAMMQSPGDDAAVQEFAEALRDFDFSGIELTPPTTLVQDRLDLDLDGTRVEILYVGPAHTAGDVIVHLPEERIVFGGDILFISCTPIGWEGTFSAWMKALDRIIELEPEAVVPGHGPVCGVEAVGELKRYLEYVASESRRFFEAGLPAFEAAKRIDLGPYADWDEPYRLIFNVERAYRELRGEPWNTPVNAVELFRAAHELRLHMEASRG
jgi:glyoxylase-like metal-dependent hydrolase (beta-lactamase superfamily II)